MRSKQIAIPEGQYRNIFRFPREAWPALEGTGSELHRLTCIRNHFPKKKRSCYVTRLVSLFTFVKPTLHFLCRFSPKVYTGGIIRSPSIFLEPERLLYFFNNFVSRFYFLGLNHASSISSASVCGSGSRNARAATSVGQIASFHARR